MVGALRVRGGNEMMFTAGPQAWPMPGCDRRTRCMTDGVLQAHCDVDDSLRSAGRPSNEPAWVQQSSRTTASNGNVADIRGTASRPLN